MGRSSRVAVGIRVPGVGTSPALSGMPVATRGPLRAVLGAGAEGEVGGVEAMRVL